MFRGGWRGASSPNKRAAGVDFGESEPPATTEIELTGITLTVPDWKSRVIVVDAPRIWTLAEAR